ncbi:MAG: phosphodiesterase YaeI [Acidobacteria bacterium]|nr:phosphodiesterase YaeI [Acidobacteriota bacterium]
MKRTLLYSSLAIIACLGLYTRFWEPNWLEQTTRRIPISRLARPVRAVHLSDLHASPEVSPDLIDESFRMAIAAKPDVVLLTGDFVTTTTTFDRATLISQLKRLAQAVPTFAVLGNHDGGEWSLSCGDSDSTEALRSVLRESGVVLLDNESRLIELNSQTVQLVGVGDLWSGEINPARAFAQAKPGVPTILLSHNPDTKAQLKRYEWDLMLSGHTHGGQVVMPILGWSHVPMWDHRFTRGLNPWQGRWIHITRGVGNVRGIRFNCRPEVSVLNLEPKAM